MFCANKDPKIPNDRKITVWPQWLTAFASKYTINQQNILIKTA